MSIKEAIATIVMTLFLVSVGIAFTACSGEPGASNEPGENEEVRAELKVDPNGFAADKNLHPKDLDDLQLALLSSGIEEWSVVEDTVQVDLIAGSHAVSLPVQQHSRLTDLNGDGIEEHLLEVDLAAGRKAHKELSGFHPHTIRVQYVSKVRWIPGGSANSSTVSASLPSTAVATNSSGQTVNYEHVVSASLFNTAMATDDVSTFCYANGDVLNMTDSITCKYESSVEDLDVQQVVDDINLWIEASGANIPDNATTVIEAWSGKGPAQRSTYFDCNECNVHTGEPGPPGYAATAVSLDELDLLSVYVGQNGKDGTFAAGSTSLVSRKNLHDISDVNMTKPREAGIMVIAGSGGAGGGWAQWCKLFDTGCSSGRDGYAAGQAPLSADNDTSAAGDGVTGSDRHGEGGNLDGEGSRGTGAHDSAERYGTDGIGGFGGMDRFSDNSQSVFEGYSVTWTYGAGGDSDGHRGDATGGGGFGGGGGGGGGSKDWRGGGGGGGSWSLQATIAPDTKLVHGANEDSDPTVMITFDVEYN